MICPQINKIKLPPYGEARAQPQRGQIASAQGGPVLVSALAGSAQYPWQAVILGEGAKGPIRAQVKCLRVFPSRNGLPREDSVWLFIRKNPDGKIKYSLSNAPREIPFAELCQASLLRWPIEQCFEEGKSRLGMDQYEHRSWPAWHRHMLYVFLGLHFLLQLRIKFKKNSSADSASSAEINGSSPAASYAYRIGGNSNREISHSA